MNGGGVGLEGEVPLKAKALREALCRWFDQAGRDLPWRGSGRENREKRFDPYAVWVSEIMLQQTQVATVVPYFHRWMATFPSVEALAAAPLERVLKQWEGLGYYARVRNLHRAAQEVVSQHGGSLPQSLAAWQALPGVGRYTAGALMSIGYNQSAPLVDANVARVLGRLLALEHPAQSSAGQKALWAAAEILVPTGPEGPEINPRSFNQGLMELGALLCKPSAPDCPACPISTHCRAYALGAPEEYPPAAKKKTRPLREGVMLLIEAEGQWLLRQRPAKGLWGGMWEFPWQEAPSPGLAAARGLYTAFFAGSGVEGRAEGVTKGASFRQLGGCRVVLTHLALEVVCYSVSDESTLQVLKAEGEMPLRWVSQEELESLPLSGVARAGWKILEGEKPARPGRRSGHPGK